MENFDDQHFDEEENYCTQKDFDNLDSQVFDLEQAFNDLLLIIIKSPSIGEDVKEEVKQKIKQYLPVKYQ